MKPGGRFTILTDNEWYGNYLLKLIAELSRKRSDEDDNFNLKSVAAPFKTKRNGGMVFIRRNGESRNREVMYVLRETFYNETCALLVNCSKRVVNV